MATFIDTTDRNGFLIEYDSKFMTTMTDRC